MRMCVLLSDALKHKQFAQGGYTMSLRYKGGDVKLHVFPAYMHLSEMSSALISRGGWCLAVNVKVGDFTRWLGYWVSVEDGDFTRMLMAESL